MIHFKNNILFGTSFCLFCFVRCLAEVSTLADNDVTIAESSIRKTFNDLFTSFKIPVVKPTSKLKEFSTIHNFFISITLSDGENLQKIVDLSRVYGIDNNTQHFITQIYEIFTEGDKNTEVPDDKYVDTHIVKFIQKLKDLKNSYIFNKNFANYSINANILEHLKKSEVKGNANDDSFEDLWRSTQASGRRIFQGHRTRIKHYPFVVSVHFFERFQCAGSIIQKDLVITAASCLQLAWNNRFFRENPAFLSIQVGSNFYEAHGENIPVLEIYFHPEYTPKTLANNIAIMRLGKHLVFNKKTQKIKRIEIDRNPAPLAVNTDGIVIVGWGARDHNNLVYDPWINKLNYAELSFYSLLECQNVYSKEFVTTKNFCAGFFSKAGGACQHDIGGPGVASGILVGVISFGPPTCGTPDAPTVFTKVGFYADWIDEIDDMYVPSARQRTTSLQTTPFIIPYYLERTTRSYQVEPMTVHEKNPVPALSNTTEPKKSLRILGDDKSFKEFMGTVFDKSDYHDYAEMYEDEKTILDQTQYNNVTITTSVTATVSNNITPKQPLQMRAVNDQDLSAGKENSKLLTDISNIDTNRSSEEYVPKTKHSEDKVKEEDQALSANDESNMENDIKELLDDIDIHKIMDSKEFRSSGEDRNVSIKTKELLSTIDTDKNKTTSIKPVELLNSNDENKNKTPHMKSEELLTSTDKYKNETLHRKPEELLSQADKDINKTLHIESKEPVNISEKNGTKPLSTELRLPLSSNVGDKNITLRTMEQIVPNNTDILISSSESFESSSYSFDESISGDDSLGLVIDL